MMSGRVRLLKWKAINLKTYALYRAGKFVQILCGMRDCVDTGRCNRIHTFSKYKVSTNFSGFENSGYIYTLSVIILFRIHSRYEHWAWGIIIIIIGISIGNYTVREVLMKNCTRVWRNTASAKTSVISF